MCYSGPMASESLHRISVEEYLALERRSETKSEYLHGETYAMAGASRSHNLIAGNVFAALHQQLPGRGCEVYSNDMRLRASAADLLTYPDVAVSCDPQFADEEVDTLLSPTLIIEVLSPSRESYDRGAKFGAYRAIPSFAEYLLLAQEPGLCAEHFVKQPAGGWLLTETRRPEDVLDLPSIGCTLAMRDVYERVDLPGRGQQPGPAGQPDPPSASRNTSSISAAAVSHRNRAACSIPRAFSSS